MTAEETKAPLLDLHTLIVRPFMKIDGVDYDLLNPDELPIVARERLALKAKRFNELLKMAEPTPAKETELSALLDELCRTLLVQVPEALHVKFTDLQRLKIVDAYFFDFLKTHSGTADAPQETTPQGPTGASSPPGSSASTEAAPSTG